ncbi:MAG: protein kinase [Gemmataceae bacterium]|nr:protein kinase [Gemmataceae bacterium]
MPHPDDFSQLSPQDWEDFQTCVGNFERAWSENPESIKIADYLPAFNSSFRHTVLYELVKIDLGHRWESDKALPLDWYLEHYTELGSRETVSAELVFEEVRNKHKHGMPIKLETYQKNYPHQFPKLKQLIDQHLGGLAALSGAPGSGGQHFGGSPGVGATPSRGSGRSSNAVIPEVGVFAREYELLRKIGEGSFAEVWLARHSDSGKEVAVKYLHRPLSAEESQRELKSLQMIKSLEHPHLLDYHIFWEEHKRLWVVMGFARYGTMKNRLKECKRLGLLAVPLDELLVYMQQIADAIDYLHDQGIQHRDIKPENILLFGPRYAKLADFGLAKQLTPEKDQTRTVGGTGTPLYMAPEMWDGVVVNRFSDQYCFAFTYSELRMGKSPFEGRKMHQLEHAHKKERPEFTLPPLEQDVLMRALAKEPTARFPTCAEFVRRLTDAIADSRRLGLLPPVSETAAMESRLAPGKAKVGSGVGSGPGSAPGSGPAAAPAAGSAQLLKSPSTAGGDSSSDSDAQSRTSTLPIPPGAGPGKTPSQTPAPDRTPAQPPGATPVKPARQAGPSATPVRPPAAESHKAPTEPRQADQASEPTPARPATPGPATTGPAAPGPATTRPAATGPAITGPVGEDPSSRSAATPTYPGSPASPADTGERADDVTGTIRLGPRGAHRPPTQAEFQLPDVAAAEFPRPQQPPTTAKPQPGKSQPPVKPQPPAKPVAPAKPTAPGRASLEIEDFVVGEVIGRGEFGEVRKARHKHTNHEYALKRLFRSAGDDTTRKELESLKSLKELSHPGIVQVHDFLIDSNDQVWIVMELAEGGSLRERLQACRRGIPVAELLPYIKQIAAGLDYLNDHGCVHRDVKPANILLSGRDAKLTDFGLARLSARDEVIRTLGGTPLYKAPEMYDGKNIPHASDLYCLAITYAELRRGEHPYAAYADGPRKRLGIEHAVRFEPPNLSGLPEAEQAVLQQALAKAYQDRFRTCGEFVAALEAAVAKSGAPTGAAKAEKKAGKKPEEQGEDQAEFNYQEPEPKRFGWLVAAVLLAAVLGGGFLGYRFLFPNPAATRDALIQSMSASIDTDTPDIDKAYGEVEKAQKLGPPFSDEVANAFNEASQKKIDELAKKNDLKTACALAKSVAKHVPGHPSLNQVKQQWLTSISAQIQAGDVKAFGELAEFTSTLPAETLKDPHRAVWDCDKTIASARSDKSWTDALARVDGLAADAPKLQRPLYKKLFDACIERGNRDNLQALGVIYDKHLSPAEKVAVTKGLQTAYGKQMKALLGDVKTAYGTDGFSAKLKATDGLRDEFFKRYDQKLVTEHDGVRQFWGRLDELDKSLDAKSPDHSPKEALRRYVAVLNLKATQPFPVNLHEHTNQILDLVEKYPDDIKDGFLEHKKAVLALGLPDATRARVVKLSTGAPSDAIAAAIAKALTRHNDRQPAECLKELEKVDLQKVSPKLKGMYRALNSLSKYHVAAAKDKEKALDDVLNVLGDKHKDGELPKTLQLDLWDVASAEQPMLPSAPQIHEFATAANKDVFARVLDRFIEKEIAGAFPSQSTDWENRLKLCRLADAKDKGFWTRTCEVECLVETKHPLTDREKLLSGTVPAKNAASAYHAFVQALALKSENKQNEAIAALLAAKEHLASLPHGDRKLRVAKMLLDSIASMKDFERGGLGRFTDPKQAQRARDRLTVARELNGESIPIKVNLVLALASLEPKNDAERAALQKLVHEVEPKLKKDGKPDKDWYPVKAAYAAAAANTVDRLRGYGELVKEVKKHPGAVDDVSLNEAVLAPVIKDYKASDPPAGAKADVAEMFALQADLIKQGRVKWDPAGRNQEVFDLYHRASDLEPKNVDYIFGKAKSRVETRDFDFMQKKDWKEIEGWVADARAVAEATKRDEALMTSQWLAGWTALQMARLETEDKAKLTALKVSIGALDAAVAALRGSEGPSAALLLIDRSQAALELGHCYSYLPKGYQKEFNGAQNAAKSFGDAADFAKRALKAHEVAPDAGAHGVAARDRAILIQHSIGNAHEDLALYAGQNPPQNYGDAEAAFTKAIDVLKSERPATRTGRGRVRYNWAKLEAENNVVRMQKLFDSASEDCIEAIRLAGDSWEAVEPTCFLGMIHSNVAYYRNAIKRYEKLRGTRAPSNLAHSAALGYIKGAITYVAVREKENLERYARLMLEVDPSRAADLYLRKALFYVQDKQGDPIKGFDELLGKQPGALESAALLVRCRFQISKYKGADNTIVIPEKEREIILSQLRNNCDVAPDKYLKVLSRYLTASILHFSKAEKELEEALQHYRAGKALADELLQMHGDWQNIEAYRKNTGIQWKSVDQWNALYALYEDGATFLLGRAKNDEANKAKYLAEAASFIQEAIRLAPVAVRERLYTIERQIKDEKGGK